MVDQENIFERLALGTAQFGMPYGVANLHGQIRPAECASILEFGQQLGMRSLDTAIGYGNSESLLGSFGVGSWNIISKLPSLSLNTSPIHDWVFSNVRKSLKQLNVVELYGILLHDVSDLKSSSGDLLFGALRALKEHGLAKKIGVSIYQPDDIPWLLSNYEPDIIQVPFNVFDQRLKSRGYISLFSGCATELHVRSVFLQGLLLMEEGTRPSKFQRWIGDFERWHSWLERSKITALAACLAFVMAHPEIAKIIVGIDGLSQLREIAAAVIQAQKLEGFEQLEVADEALINPTMWSNL